MHQNVQLLFKVAAEHTPGDDWLTSAGFQHPAAVDKHLC